MDLIEAKVIDTQYGMELFMDKKNDVDVLAIHSPTVTNPYFDLKVGISYYLIKEHYYQRRKNYFWIRMDKYNNSITFKESEKESIFAVKTIEERKATQALITEWLLYSQTFKKALNKTLKEILTKNIETEEDIKEINELKIFLEKLLNIKDVVILDAITEKR